MAHGTNQISQPDIRNLSQTLMDVLHALNEQLSTGPVSVPVEPGSIKAYLADNFHLEHPRPLPTLASEIFEVLQRGIVHPNHPRHFGLFVPNVCAAGVLGDALAALLNPQLGAWWYAPAACEIEDFVLEACAAKLGFHGPGQSAHFTSGGSEANATAVLLALTRAFPEYSKVGRVSSSKTPVLYTSEQAHDSFVKIAQMTGIGRIAIHRIRTDSAFRIDVDDLRRQYRSDLQDGMEPFLIVATAGTTAAGAFDQLPGLVEFNRETGLWLHVDAAWGGLALLLDELRPLVSAIDEADSVTWDAHKVFPVPMGAGMFFASKSSAQQAFEVKTPYVPSERQGTVDLYRHSMQWSRRFIGLKVFLTLAELGWAGMASLLRNQVNVGNALRNKLLSAGFRIVNETPLPVVCFTHSTLLNRQKTAAEVVETLVSRGQVWLSSVRLRPDEPESIRACITNHRTSHGDVDLLVSEVTRAVSS
jgi:aromatic-L-amino-acid/L-tryptophan decarboxylase